MGPPMAPAVASRPPLRSSSRSGGQPGPPTRSTTTSTDAARAPGEGSLSRGRTSSAPSARTAASLAAEATANTSAPRRFASCTAAEPTPPEAPVTSTRSPLVTLARWSRFSAVEYAHGMEASSASSQSLSTRKTSVDGHLDVLGESAVDLRAERPTRRRRGHGRAHDGANQHPLPDSRGVHTVSDRDDATAAVRSLDPREGDRGACPRPSRPSDAS